MEYITKLFITFIIYSSMGWCVEEFYAIFITKNKTNRGFLVGPLCPIYGFTSIALIILLDGFKDNIIVLFLLSVLIAAVIEYLTSWILEKFFNVKLWDYTGDSKYELKGRIALFTLIPFGVLGTVAITIVNPFIQSLINGVNINILYNIAIIISVILFIDIIFSAFIIKKTSGSGDITDKKNEEVKKHLKNTSEVVQKSIKNSTIAVQNQVKNTTKVVQSSIKKSNENMKKIIKK